MDITKFKYLNSALVTVPSQWLEFLCHYENLLLNIDKQLSSLALNSEVIYPEKSDIFAPLGALTPSEIKIIILGQDPYHTPLVANGLAFASKRPQPLPPSLANIYKELAYEYGINHKEFKSDLIQTWVNKGVFLLNATLTVLKAKPNSLSHIGWQEITDGIIRYLSGTRTNLVFMLWGNFAISKANLIDANKHLVLKATHPSPFSAHRGFFGCNHFKLANEYLLQCGLEPVKFC